MNLSDIELPSNRKFGFVFSAVFTAIGAYLFYKGTTLPALGLFALASVLLIVTLLKAELLLPLNKLWMRFGLLIGMVVSPIVLGVIFFVLFTPISLLMKLSGRDELRLKPGNRTSFWKDRDTDALQAGSFKQQF